MWHWDGLQECLHCWHIFELCALAVLRIKRCTGSTSCEMSSKGKKKNAPAAGSQGQPASDEGSKAVMDAVKMERRKHVVDQLKTGNILIFDARAMFHKVADLKEVH